jgi:hypothetical protein
VTDFRNAWEKIQHEEDEQQVSKTFA